MKLRVAVTGSTGLIGQYLISDFISPYEVISLGRSVGQFESLKLKNYYFDLLNLKTISTTLNNAQPDVILHLAAKTHIDAVESDAHLGLKSEGWKTNVLATQEIANYCESTYTHLILMSTECVFDGSNKSYQETDSTNPINWYGHTKAEAEKIVKQLNCPTSIVRAVIAYSTQKLKEKTLYGSILKSLKSNQPFELVNDQRITPTYIPDLIQALSIIIDQHLTGIFHITPSQILTPFTFGQTVAAHFNYNLDLIEPTTLVDFFGEERAKLRVKQACLDSLYTQRQLKMEFKNLQEVLKNNL